MQKRHLLSWLDQPLGRCFGAQLNPMHHLGALTIFFFWIVLISGIWLFIFFRTSVQGAYESVEYLTYQQWYVGGVMRSLHRYASDAAVVTLVLHILREWLQGHHRGKRWFSWVTGMPLLWIVIPLGISGYWLVWDQLGLYVAITSAELIDWLPIFTGSMARNFLTVAELSDRFFTLMAFLHLIGLPLFLVFAIWLHVFRISRPRINPPRALMAGTLLAMLALSLVYPAISQGQAEPATVPQNLRLDWYYLLVYPLVQAWGPAGVWALLTSFSALLFLAPWLPSRTASAKEIKGRSERPVAVVDLENCNGCQRCAEDCPYSAVMMQPRSDGSRYEQEAVVDPSLCVSCGICVGACPTATPFRQASALVPGIDLPDLGALTIRLQIEEQSTRMQGQQRVFVFVCDDSDGSAALADTQTAVIPLRCMAHLPPAFIDFILSRGHADGVYLAGCRSGRCEYRLGIEWTRQRVARERDPRLRERTDRQRLALGWEDQWSQHGSINRRLSAFRSQLAAPLDKPAHGKPVWQRLPLQALAYGLFVVVASVFSAWPAFSLLQHDEAMVSLSVSHTGQRIQECRTFTQKELMELPPNMRRPSDCPREKHPIRVELTADGYLLYQETLQPSGIWSDGSSTVYARFPLTAGKRTLTVAMNDSGQPSGFDYYLAKQVTLKPGQHLVISFDPLQQNFKFE